MGGGTSGGAGPGTGGRARFQYSSLTGRDGEKEGGGEEVGGSDKVAWVIPNLAAGTDGGRGWTIKASQGGASEEKGSSYSQGKGPLERISEGSPIEEAPEVPVRDSSSP